MRTWIWTVLLLNLSVALGCRGPAQWRYEDALERTPVRAAHGVHDERLAVVMRELDRSRNERLTQSFDVRERAERQHREFARVAQAMAESAARISAAPPPGLDADQLAAFRSSAADLERASTQLAQEGFGGPRRRALLAEIDSACNQCHGRFRIPGVVEGDD